MTWTWNISESFLSALSFSVLKHSNGVASAEFFSAMINSIDTWVTALAEEITDSVVLSGNNSTVSIMHSDIVLEM